MGDEVGIVKGLRDSGVKEEFAHVTAVAGRALSRQGRKDRGERYDYVPNVEMLSWKRKWIRMVGWCFDLDGRRDKDECAKPTIGRASNLAYGNVAVFSMVRLQEAKMRKTLQGNNRSGDGVSGIKVKESKK